MAETIAFVVLLVMVAFTVAVHVWARIQTRRTYAEIRAMMADANRNLDALEEWLASEAKE